MFSQKQWKTFMVESFKVFLVKKSGKNVFVKKLPLSLKTKATI